MKKNENIDILITYPAERKMLHSPMIPLGIASLAMVLEENDYRVNVVDFNRYRGNFEADLTRWNPKVIGIGGTTATRQGSFNIAKSAKKLLPDTPVVYGGVHATFAAEDTIINIPEMDYILKGEAEYSFPELCDILVRGKKKKLEEISGICFRNGGGLVNNKQERINDLSGLPVARRDFFNDNAPMKIDYYNIDAEPVITSRGCPTTCTFCSASRMFPGGVRQRSVESISEEIGQLLKNDNIKGLKIFDSIFTANREFVQRFCEMIKPYNVIWECEVRVDSVDYELLNIMRDAGCRVIDMGLETTDEKLLKSLNKRITVKQAEQVLEWCSDLDIRTKVFFIFGLPGQTFRNILKDIRWLRKNRHRIYHFANGIGMRVYPGTAVEKQVREMNLIDNNFSWAKFKPPLKNMFLSEFNDIMILYQKQLGVPKLMAASILLYLQGTCLTPEYTRKQIRNFLSELKRLLFSGRNK